MNTAHTSPEFFGSINTADNKRIAITSGELGFFVTIFDYNEDTETQREYRNAAEMMDAVSSLLLSATAMMEIQNA